MVFLLPCNTITISSSLAVVLAVACRRCGLAEKGYRVAVLEMGRRIDSADMDAAATNPLKLFWMPRLGMRGYFVQTVLRHVGIVGGVGVGGGSIVYAAVLLEPPETFFRDPAWNDLHADWQGALAPHYATA